MTPRRRTGLAMPDEALHHDPQIVRVAPVAPAHCIGDRKNFDFGCERKVGYKVGPAIDAGAKSDGSNRRLTQHNAIYEAVPVAAHSSR